MKFRRETATHEADLPHQFQEGQTPKVCTVCTMVSDEPRHKAWEQAQLTEREVAHAALQRETGS